MSEQTKSAAERVDKIEDHLSSYDCGDARGWTETVTAGHIRFLLSRLRAAENDLADALDVKECKGPTALSAVVADRDDLKAENEVHVAEHDISDGLLEDEKAQNAKLREALQRIVDDCDLPKHEYGILERNAIRGARDALGDE